MCQKSTAHEQRRSRAESRKRRFGSNHTAPKIWQERDNMLFTRPYQPIDWREHTTGAVHDWNFPTRSLQVQEGWENFLWHRVKVRSIMTGLRHDHEQDDDRSHRRASIVTSLDTRCFRLITNILIQSRASCMIARWYQCGTMTSQMLARASFSAFCLTVFPFEFRSRTFTIGFYGKKSFISELMILECSFPLTTQVLLLKSLESNGDRRNYLSSWEENVLGRLAVVSEGLAETLMSRIQNIQAIWSLDEPRAAAMSSPGFSALVSIHASSSSHTPGSRCQPRLASPHAILPSISGCCAGKRVRPISCEQTHTHYSVVIGSAEALPILCVSDFCE